jgi:hypothetical protein
VEEAELGHLVAQRPYENLVDTGGLQSVQTVGAISGGTDQKAIAQIRGRGGRAHRQPER